MEVLSEIAPWPILQANIAHSYGHRLTGKGKKDTEEENEANCNVKMEMTRREQYISIIYTQPSKTKNNLGASKPKRMDKRWRRKFKIKKNMNLYEKMKMKNNLIIEFKLSDLRRDLSV